MCQAPLNPQVAVVAAEITAFSVVFCVLVCAGYLILPVDLTRDLTSLMLWAALFSVLYVIYT